VYLLSATDKHVSVRGKKSVHILST